jgi:hypothetical protein
MIVIPPLGDVEGNFRVCMTHERDQVCCRLKDYVQATGGEADANVPGEVHFLGHENHPHLQVSPDGALDAEGVVSGKPLWGVWYPFHPGMAWLDGTFVVDYMADAHSQVMGEVHNPLFRGARCRLLV